VHFGISLLIKTTAVCAFFHDNHGHSHEMFSATKLFDESVNQVIANRVEQPDVIAPNRVEQPDVIANRVEQPDLDALNEGLRIDSHEWIDVYEPTRRLPENCLFVPPTRMPRRTQLSRLAAKFQCIG
jgi:hypothetical protein